MYCIINENVPRSHTSLFQTRVGTYHLLPFALLCVLHNIWQYTANVAPPLLQTANMVCIHVRQLPNFALVR